MCRRKAIDEAKKVAALCKVKHHSLYIECLNCGEVFGRDGHIEIDDAQYCVDRAINNLVCPVCGADTIDQFYIEDEVSQDQFEGWDGKVDLQGATEDGQIGELIMKARDTKGNA